MISNIMHNRKPKTVKIISNTDDFFHKAAMSAAQVVTMPDEQAQNCIMCYYY